jgi:RadC-like JAB domain
VNWPEPIGQTYEITGSPLLNEIFPSSTLMHNHPSGDSSLSQADITMAKAVIDIATPARHRRARPHHRRQERACELEGAEADLACPLSIDAQIARQYRDHVIQPIDHRSV